MAPSRAIASCAFECTPLGGGRAEPKAASTHAEKKVGIVSEYTFLFLPSHAPWRQEKDMVFGGANGVARYEVLKESIYTSRARKEDRTCVHQSYDRAKMITGAAGGSPPERSTTHSMLCENAAQSVPHTFEVRDLERSTSDVDVEAVRPPAKCMRSLNPGQSRAP